MPKSMFKNGEFKELEFKVLGLVKSPTKKWIVLKIQKLTIFQLQVEKSDAQKQTMIDKGKEMLAEAKVRDVVEQMMLKKYKQSFILSDYRIL